ncbi:response regulator [Pseudomonas sp. D47]|uniref:response regulator transcription factor n=1 Tax=Pseudomonas sp. D47 TaxID=3159447 RepID=UPI00387AD8B8
MRWSELKPLQIALLDDHALIRDALKARLSLEPTFKVAGIYSTSRGLMEGLREAPVDLLILDYQLSDGEMDGLRLIDWLRKQYPELRIVVFSSMERPATVNMSIRAGARGFVGKSQESDDLIRAIRTVALDRIYLAPNMASELEKLPVPQDQDVGDSLETHALANFSELSPKESEVLRCCLDGLSVSQIAEKFSRSRKTISGQKQSAFRKLGIRTDTELFKLQNQLGFS